MRSKAIWTLLVALSLLCSLATAGETVNGLPLHIEKLSDNAIRLWIGDYISSTAVAALKTDKGIVVIDATESPLLDKQFRKIIAREFGRDDFVYLINTHEHGDHTTGNSVYADLEIIAHKNCAEGMRMRREDTERLIGWYTERIPELESERAELEKGSDQYKQHSEDMIIKKMILESLQAGHKQTFPTKTFSDSMKLDMGNLTLELYAMGGTHTASDIFVFVPEEGLLFTGDMLADIWLTDTPGCLQAFSIRQGIKRDLPLLLENWKKLIARKDEIKDYIPAHWNGDLTYEGFVDRYNYVKTLSAGVTQAIAADQKLEEILAEFNINDKYPKLVGTPGFTQEFVHYGSLLALWSDLTGAESASNALAVMIEEQGLKPAIAKIKTAHKQETDEYYFLEAEFNRLGYQFMGQQKLSEAIAVFELNVALYPDSWNVYDSLGEAYKGQGQLDLAITNYKKSLAINPENENGQQVLAELTTAQAQK